MKYLLALGFLGMAMGDQYVRVDGNACTGANVLTPECTCEGMGYETITDTDECLAAGATQPFVDGTSPDLSNVVWGSINHNSGTLQPGCNHGGAPHSYKMYFATQTSEPGGHCTQFNNEGMHCICKVPAAAGAAGGDACAAAANPAEYIDAQCCDCA